jgi:hypothetical protein
VPPGGAASADGATAFQDQDLAPVLLHGPREAQASNAGADHHYVNSSRLHVLPSCGSIFVARTARDSGVIQARLPQFFTENAPISKRLSYPERSAASLAAVPGEWKDNNEQNRENK